MGKLAQLAADVEMAARLAEGPNLREEDKIRDPEYWARSAIEKDFFALQRAADRFAASTQGGMRPLSFEQEFRLFMVRRQLHEIAAKGTTKYATKPVDEVWPINLKAAE